MDTQFFPGLSYKSMTSAAATSRISRSGHVVQQVPLCTHWKSILKSILTGR